MEATRPDHSCEATCLQAFQLDTGTMNEQSDVERHSVEKSRLWGIHEAWERKIAKQ